MNTPPGRPGSANGSANGSATRRSTGSRARLVAARDFDKVFRHGQRSSDPLFTILYLENGLAEPRLGFAISRRNVRRAVGRNRLRRLARESFRQQLGTLPPLDLVIMARPKADEAGNPEVFASLARHWNRIVRRVAGGQ